LTDFGADGGEALGEFRCHQGADRDALVVELLELFELAGLESFERSKNCLDGGMPRYVGCCSAYFEWCGGGMTTAATFLWELLGATDWVRSSDHRFWVMILDRGIFSVS
jgi:hypothetical protein